ncbi:MAG: isopentenyl transferase family protein [Rivularia sp. (in: cyanobacteria)]
MDLKIVKIDRVSGHRYYLYLSFAQTVKMNSRRYRITVKMKRVAVFGNTGGGKSTLSKRLAQTTGLPLTVLDLVQYKPGGEKVSDEEYKTVHEKILQQDCWIVDGFGSLDTVWKRLEVADTLVYIDLPVLQHYFWVTKRLIKGLWVAPEGYPENSPLVKSTLNAYYIVSLCHQKLTPRYREYVEKAKSTKQVFHLQSTRDIKEFWHRLTAC